MYASDASDGIRESPIVDHIFSTDASGQLKASAILAQHSLDVGAREDLGNRWSAQWSEKGQEDTNIKPTDASSDSDCDSDSDCPVIPPPRATQSTVALREQILARTLFELREVGFKLSDLGDHLQQSSITHLSNDQRKEVGIGRGQLRHFVMQLDKLLDLPDVTPPSQKINSPLVVTGSPLKRKASLYCPGVGCTSPLAPPLTGLFSPTLLTHVCHHWREIAHATPALWRAISLDLTKPSSGETDNNLLHPWMTRSRAYSISFSINGAYNCVNATSRCIGTLSSHRARWEYLELSWMADDILPFLCDPMPSLRHLDVSFHDECSTFTLGDAPLLRSVKISVHTEFLILPWRQLTSLVLVFVFPVECTEILQQTKLLVHCEVSFPHISVEEVQQPDIELPFLQSFILILMQEESIEPSYLYRLILPALRTLQIPYWDLGTDPINGLASFISKSGCTLRELRITGEQSVGATAAYRTAFSTIPKLSFPPFDTRVPGLVSGK
ncbi:hypothetical protein C8R43DRAFT_1193004 [Mycena crocata]|nr:hypothetical protein C8R43DRAFT_1193004 [Mycena crocata]